MGYFDKLREQAASLGAQIDQALDTTKIKGPGGLPAEESRGARGPARGSPAGAIQAGGFRC
jgi:hypothetical protein